MLLGLDVGGTFTDAVVIEGSRVIAYAKTPTTHNCLLECITAVIDAVLCGIRPDELQRVALSTTIVTNALVSGNIEPAALVIIPGPGADITPFLPVEPIVLSGGTDHCGRETAIPADDEITAAVRCLKGYRLAAVSGKFAVRNRSQERYVAAKLQEALPLRFVVEAAGLSSTLNFWRRTNSAFYNAAVWPCFDMFVRSVERALTERGVKAAVCILKADGGAIALAAAKAMPVEAVFTGPAASVLGIMAVAQPAGRAVSLDVGGTTTDIALWRDGTPLSAEKGIVINGFPTAVRGFWLRSVGVGGDSYVRWEGERLAIGPERRGPAMALGGSYPTLSDALIVLRQAEFGDRRLAVQAMDRLAAGRMAAEVMARQVIDAAVQEICQAIDKLINDWNDRPLYRVDDINTSQTFDVQAIVGVGGGAGGLVPFVAKQMGLCYTIPAGSEVVNAAGAAVAKPTMTAAIRADTVSGNYCIAQEGALKPIEQRPFGCRQAIELAERYLRKQAALARIPADDIQILAQEEFHVVRNFYTAGKIITSELQLVPGVLSYIDGFDRKEQQDG